MNTDRDLPGSGGRWPGPHDDDVAGCAVAFLVTLGMLGIIAATVVALAIVFR